MQSKISTKDLLERITQQNQYIKIRCVFHEEKTPSMVLILKRNRFHCFGCGEDGIFMIKNNSIIFE